MRGNGLPYDRESEMGQIFRVEIADDPSAQIMVAATKTAGRYSLMAFKQVFVGGEYQTVERYGESDDDAALIAAAIARIADQLRASGETVVV